MHYCAEGLALQCLSCCVGYAGNFAIYYCKVWLTESHQSYYQVTAYRSCMSPSSMGYTVMHSSYTNQRRRKVVLDDQYTQLSKNLSCHLRSVSSWVCLHNLQPSCSKLSHSSYFFQASLSSPSSSLQSKNITYRLHAVRGCVKLQSKQTYGIRTTDI